MPATPSWKNQTPATPSWRKREIMKREKTIYNQKKRDHMQCLREREKETLVSGTEEEKRKSYPLTGTCLLLFIRTIHSFLFKKEGKA